MVSSEIELDHIPAASMMREGEGAVAQDIGSLLAELYIIAAAVENERSIEIGGVTKRKMQLCEGEFCYKDEHGYDIPYRRMFEDSMRTYATNRQLVERFQSEMIVWGRAAELAKEIEVGEAIAIISPPREIYRFPGQQALSATFILLKNANDEFEAYSLYIPEISEEEHRRIVGLPDDFGERETLELPVVVDDANDLVSRLGFDGWGEIERRAVDLNSEESIKQRAVYQAIVRLNERFIDQQNVEFRLGFADMIRDLLLKDVLGKFIDSEVEEIYQEGLLFLRAKNVRKLDDKLAWIFGVEGVSIQRLDEWMIEQRILQQQAVYKAMWGGHGNGSSMLGLDDKNQFLDSRANYLTNSMKKKEKNAVKCPKCEHVCGGGDKACSKCGAKLKG